MLNSGDSSMESQSGIPPPATITPGTVPAPPDPLLNGGGASNHLTDRTLPSGTGYLNSLLEPLFDEEWVLPEGSSRQDYPPLFHDHVAGSASSNLRS